MCHSRNAVLMALAFWLFGPMLIDLMATNEAVRAEARLYLIWIVLGPLIGFSSWFLDGVFIGATETRAMRIAMLQSSAIFVLAVSTLVPLWGNHGLWLAMMVFYVARTVTLGLRYKGIEAAAYAQSARPVPTASATD